MPGAKKLSIILIIALVTLFLTSVCSASGDIAFTKDEVKDTGQTLVTISKPLKNDSSPSKIIIIGGNTDYSNVKVELYIGTADGYKVKTATDGSSSLIIGSSGFFSKEIELNKGVNELLIRATKTGKPDQLSLFTVKVVEENLRDIIKNGINSLFSKITDFFK